MLNLVKKLMKGNISIELGNHFKDFVQDRIDAGRYNSTSEVIRAGLRLLEDEEKKVALLQKALAEGVNSGFLEHYNPNEHLKALHEKFKQ